MDKLKTLILGFSENEILDKTFFLVSITDSKLGVVSVSVPNLMNSSQMLDKVYMNEFIVKGLRNLDEGFEIQIIISKNGLECIEYLSLDCENISGAWVSSSEIKISKNSFVIKNGVKTKEFWNGKITRDKAPLRLKVRNVCGDESVINLG